MHHRGYSAYSTSSVQQVITSSYSTAKMSAFSALRSSRLALGSDRAKTPACIGRSIPRGHHQHVCPPLRVSAAEPVIGDKYMLSNGMVDYYAILQVDDDATAQEIKKAYRSLAKVCHPDFMGDMGHDICILLNEAYNTLSDEQARIAYNSKLEQALKDDEDDYSGEPLSKWMPTVKPAMAKNVDPNEQRAVFVDEHSCIGCKQCVWQASATFRMENEHGRSRVFAQWLDTEDNIQAAIDSCPVSCIHWVDKQQLPALEYVMQVRTKERTNVAMMMAGQGAVLDVWSATEQFLKERKRRAEAQAAASKSRAYSPAQEAARRVATQALRKQSMGVFAQFGQMMDDLMNQMNQTVSGYSEDFITVGKRKRTVRWDQVSQAARAADGRDYYLVPPERALVPVTVRNEY